MGKAILLFSDGYSISEIARGTEAESRKIMTNKYNDAADNVEALWLEQSYCEENDAILLDASTTVLELTKLIAEGDKRHLSILTNSFYAVDILKQKKDRHPKVTWCKE